jgi:hypothetical protein
MLTPYFFGRGEGNRGYYAGMQSRVIVPTVFRDDYIGGLRRMTQQDDPSVLRKRCAARR